MVCFFERFVCHMNKRILLKRIKLLTAAQDRITDRAERQNRHPTTEEWDEVGRLDKRVKPLQLKWMARVRRREAQRMRTERAMVAKAKELLERR